MPLPTRCGSSASKPPASRSTEDVSAPNSPPAHRGGNARERHIAGGHCQLVRSGERRRSSSAWLRRAVGSSLGCSGGRGQADDLVPGTEAVGHLAPVFFGVEKVTTGPEMGRYPTERGQEPLRATGRAELFHRPFTSPSGLVGCVLTSCDGLAGGSPVGVAAKRPRSWWPAEGET
jgi:hypothetical protein